MAKILIVGGVAGGMSAAARIRRVDEKAQIIVFEKGDYVSFANCGLPYYIGDTITERENLLVQTPEAFHARFNVDVRVASEVLKINQKEKTLLVKNLKTQEEYQESYDKLILSPGADPVIPPISGINHPKIFTLRNIPDTDKIKAFVEKEKPQRVAIVGAGFIGLEMAENLHHLGIFVTVIEMADQVMNVIDYEMAAEVNQHLKSKGVEFYLKDGVSAFNHQEDRIQLKLASGRNLLVDAVVLSVGVRPDTKLAKDTSLELGERGGFKVNDYLQTNDPDIYAVGDAIEVKNPITKKLGIVPLAGPANKQGRIVADNIVFGNKKTYQGTIGTSIAKIFDLTVAVTGATEKLLKQENIPYISSIIHASSHAGYYPNALPMSLKIEFDPQTGKLLGAQGVGYEGVDKRIDVFALAIQCGLTVYDLREFEHSYAPPYSSAKDPVNMAAFVAENILQGQVKVIRWDEIHSLHKDEVVLLDVRNPEENVLGALEGSLNIPLDNLRNQLHQIPQNKKIIIYCGVGLRGYLASRILLQNGFTQVYNLSGGYKTYELAMQKQDNGDIFEGYKVGLDDLISTQKQQNPLPLDSSHFLEVDACGLQCPGPIMKVKTQVEKIQNGQKLLVKASDAGFYKDIQSWARVTGHSLLSLENNKGIISALIQKTTQDSKKEEKTSLSHDKTIVVFNDQLDKAIASFVIANGALAMGRKVTLFFTFWGLNIIKKPKKVKVKKSFLDKMFGFMLPRGSKKLSLSQMNMMGMGKKMIRKVMKKKGVDSLETMIQTAIQNGAELIACQMSMDVMGVKAQELLDGVKIGGVASYLEAAEKADANLFI